MKKLFLIAATCTTLATLPVYASENKDSHGNADAHKTVHAQPATKKSTYVTIT